MLIEDIQLNKLYESKKYINKTYVIFREINLFDNNAKIEVYASIHYSHKIKITSLQLENFRSVKNEKTKVKLALKGLIE